MVTGFIVVLREVVAVGDDELLGIYREAKFWDDVAAVLLRLNRIDEMYLEEGNVAAVLDAFARQGKQPRQGIWFSTFPGYGDQSLRVAQAAERDFPDAAVEVYRRKAEVEIKHRQRSAYKVAAEHLAQVKAILQRLGRNDEWAGLIAEVRTTNKTLRALREELDALDLT